jgi:cyclopropane fatty-acyl-phospholipid synthase-like methyltransferase
MPRIDNKTFYNASIQKYGLQAKGVHWNSKESQYDRFKVLIDFIPDIMSSSIVDAGCGFGDLYIYLNKQVLLPQKYVGIDCEEKMVEIAQLRIKQDIMLKDILEDDIPRSDYYVSSGALNILTNEETFMFIEKCFNHCEKGFVFNMLNITEDMKEDVYNHHNPENVLAFCKKLNKKNDIKIGYLDNDFTIFMDKS